MASSDKPVWRNVQSFGDSRKGAKQWQEDSFFTWNSPSSRVTVGGVFDGHGGFNGMLASSIAKDEGIRWLNKNSSELENWSVEEWQKQLVAFFEYLHLSIREKFLTDPQSSARGDKRYVDEKGVVRTSSKDPIHGGTTASVTVMIQNSDGGCTLVTANVGDSTAVVIPPSTPKEKALDFLTVDHGPESSEEYARVQQSPNSDSQYKLLFVYDKANVFRKYECPLVFREDGTKDPIYTQNPWGNGLHPTNVRYEPAVYAVTPREISKDSTCIAMTRALGDFYAHQFGLTWQPSISVRHFSKNEEFCIVLASDGIWDCWRYDDFQNYINDLLYKKKYNIQDMGMTLLNESVTRAIANFGQKHYDDATLVCWLIRSFSEAEQSNNSSSLSSSLSSSASQLEIQLPQRSLTDHVAMVDGL